MMEYLNTTPDLIEEYSEKMRDKNPKGLANTIRSVKLPIDHPDCERFIRHRKYGLTVTAPNLNMFG